MRTFILTFAFVLSLSTYAQNNDEFKTVFGGKPIGGYGAFGGGYSSINNDDALIFDARGGVVLGNVFGIGVAGSGFFTEYQYNQVLQKKTSLAGGYGGVFMELIVLGRSPVHISFPVLAGLGGAAYTTWDNEGADYDRENTTVDAATFGVLEPGIELEFNITRFFRLAAYGKYRFASNIDITEFIDGQTVRLVSPDALNSYSAGLIFKFGKF